MTSEPSTESLQQIAFPGRPHTLGELGTFDIDETPGSRRIEYRARFVTTEVAAALQAEIAASVAGTELADADVRIAQTIEPTAVQRGLAPLPGVANLIAVASGKGGVGKSTTAVNLALALHSLGARTGLLDADIYGPSQPRMLGLTNAHPESTDGKTLLPLEAHGLQTMSAGFLVDEAQPMVWRGPMVTQALNQILTQTAWRELDYLIVDMPPGTGDIQLTLSQRVPVAGAVIVTTPQDIALIDARKGLAMFRKVGIDVLGVVENMSTHICTSCGHEEAIFGAGGAERLAAEENIAVLGRLPLDANIQRSTDSGRPTVIAEPDGPAAAHYREIAMRVSLALARTRLEHAHKFPKIVVE
ncbi:MAG: iron-sulfur cluster carrier protein ApbC [Pseudomonadota bacterium]